MEVAMQIFFKENQKKKVLPLGQKKYLDSAREGLLKSLMWPSSETIQVIWEMTPARWIFGFVLLCNLPLHFKEIKASTTGAYAGLTKYLNSRIHLSFIQKLRKQINGG